MVKRVATDKFPTANAGKVARSAIHSNLPNMNVDDVLLFAWSEISSYDAARTAAKTLGKRLSRKFSTRKMPEGLYIKRVA